MNCTVFAELAPDLALGVLAEPERAEALAHARSCRSCREELASLSSVVDELSLLAPAVEPPVGFEQRVAGALAAAVEGPATSSIVELRPARARRLLVRKRVLSVAAVVAALGAGLAAGWGIGGGTNRPAEAVPVMHGELTAQGRPVGEIIAYGGPTPWMYMTVDVGHMNGAVECVLNVSGHRVAMGSFGVTDGLGYWSAPLPESITALRGARLVQADGQVLASAVLSPG